MSGFPACSEEHLGSLKETALSALDVLDRFNQRHKNQHHVAKWWSQIGILRRAIRRLLEALHTYASHFDRASRRPMAKGSASTRCTAAADQKMKAITERASWVCNHVLPAAYISFSQTTADKQHAALGLFLVGLVAFLRQALLPVLSTPQPPGFLGNEIHSPSTRPDESADLGVAIPRHRVGADSQVSRPRQDSKVAPLSTEPVKAVGSFGQNLTGESANITSENIEGECSTRVSLKPTQHAQASAKDPKLKRKKRKKGDEFADLFGSLL